MRCWRCACCGAVSFYLLMTAADVCCLIILFQRETSEARQMEMVRAAFDHEMVEARRRISETISKAMGTLDSTGKCC